MTKVFSPGFIVKFKQGKLLFFSKLKMVRTEREVVAAARFSNFKVLQTYKSFDSHKILPERGPPIHRLLAARFSADLKQLQNRYFSTSNRSKPIPVLACTKSSSTDDSLFIGYSLPDFQLVSSSFFADPTAVLLQYIEERGSRRGGFVSL